MANDWYAEYPPSDNGKCRHCGGELDTVRLGYCTRCHVGYADVGRYSERNGETDTPTQEGHYWLSLRPNYTLVAHVYAGQCATTDGAWGALDSVPDTARWWGPIPEPQK